MIPPAASAAPDTRGRSADTHLFTSVNLEALLPHVDLFSLNACAPASALAGADHSKVRCERSLAVQRLLLGFKAVTFKQFLSGRKVSQLCRHKQ